MLVTPQIVTSQIAIFQREDGAMRYCAPRALAPVEDDDQLGWIALPADFDSLPYRWDDEARSYVVDVEQLRARRWVEVKARRDQAEWGGCVTLLGRVDTDPDSQRKVSGSVQMALIAQGAGQPFDLTWTMQDNSAVAHDAPAMIGMGVAVGRHVAACHAAALAKRAELDAGETAAEIEAVDINAGWPA